MVRIAFARELLYGMLQEEIRRTRVRPEPAGVAMGQDEPLGLSARMMNCLQTILELEPTLSRLELGYVLLAEFTVLKSFLKEMDTMELDEADVARIENATEHFLQELKTPLSLLKMSNENNVTLQ